MAPVFPMMPTLCPARSAISPIFAAAFFLESLPARPDGDHYDDVVLTQDGQRLRISRQGEVAATDCQVGFAGTQEGRGFGRSGGSDRGQSNRPAFLFEGLRHRLDHLMVVAACRADSDPERLGLEDVEQGGRSGAEDDESQSQQDQEPSLASIGGTPDCIGR
ncbi:hypothetical protein CI41S_22230 [Bradyrhizobium ivorense]|nr:hypothetical protein CI41S_22230 [Bradyrhizobium ivorense]